MTPLADPLQKVSLRKMNLELELEVLETVALVEEEEKGFSRTPQSHSREESDRTQEPDCADMGGRGGESVEASLTSAERKTSALPSAADSPSQLIQELGERVEEGLWISVQPQGSRLSRSSAQGEAERDCSQPATATDTARTGTFLELSPRRNPLLIVKTDTGDDLDEDDIDEEDY